MTYASIRADLGLAWAAIACAALVFGGCGDESGNLRDDGSVGEAGTNADGSVDGGRPDAMAIIRCFGDLDCPTGTVCEIEADALEGECRPGCRNNDDCEPPQICDQGLRICVDPPEEPCRTCADCEDGQFCDVATGVCEPGCCTEPDSCEPDGTTQTRCDEESRECVAIFVCCRADRSCDRVVEEQCQGANDRLLRTTLGCSGDPCDDFCVEDAQCDPEDYCNEEGVCVPGCRLGDLDTCPPGEVCNDEHRCGTPTCGRDEDCGPLQYCGTNERDEPVCVEGCRLGEPCPQGELWHCDERSRECRLFCDDDHPCPAEFYCAPDTELCTPLCDRHEDCDPDQYCGDDRQCWPGCRDDRNIEPNDDVDTATPIVIDNRSGSIADLVSCEDNDDYFAFELPDGWRLLASLAFDSGEAPGNLHLTLYDPDEQELANNTGLENPKALIYPHNLDDPQPVGGTYYLKVEGDRTVSRIAYSIHVTMVPPRDPLVPGEEGPLGCFRDSDDQAGRGGSANTAIRIGDEGQGQFFQIIEGSLCPDDDEDWWSIMLGRNDGFGVLICAQPGSCEIEAKLYSAFALNNPAQPNYISAEDDPRGDCAGGVVYSFDVAQSTNGFLDDPPYYLALSCARDDDNRVAEYVLTQRFDRSGDICRDDPAEPNDDRGEAVILGEDNGELPPNESVCLESLTICPNDVDYFEFEAENNDTLRATVRLATPVVDDVQVQILGPQNNPLGESDQGDEGSLTARVVGARQTTHYVRVSNAGLANGEYSLCVERESSLICPDPLEPNPRNDQRLDAAELQVISPNGVQRYELINSAICHPGGLEDEDWYEFTVEEAHSRIIVHADFIHAAGDLNLELWRDGEEIDIDRSNGERNGELISYDPPFVDAGDYQVRVLAEDHEENTYNLTVTVVPPDEESCPPDFHESNNSLPDASFIGGADVRIGDLWICTEAPNERVTGDWFQLSVDDRDRTIHVEYSAVDGRIGVFVYAPSVADPDMLIPTAINEEGTTVQCANIEAGTESQDIWVQFIAPARLMDGDLRVDYVMQVVETDLDANARGECDVLSDGAFENVDWPTIVLP